MKPIQTILILLTLATLSSCGAFHRSDKEGRGLEIYSVKDIKLVHRIDGQDCQYCFDVKSENLDSVLVGPIKPEDFDWDNQTIATGFLTALDIPLSGYPVALVIDGEPIYGFWLWNMVSSYACDRVFGAVGGQELHLKFAHMPEWRVGKDPRFDPRIKQYLERE